MLQFKLYLLIFINQLPQKTIKKLIFYVRKKFKIMSFLFETT